MSAGSPAAAQRRLCGARPGHKLKRHDAMPVPNAKRAHREATARALLQPLRSLSSGARFDPPGEADPGRVVAPAARGSDERLLKPQRFAPAHHGAAERA